MWHTHAWRYHKSPVSGRREWSKSSCSLSTKRGIKCHAFHTWCSPHFRAPMFRQECDSWVAAEEVFKHVVFAQELLSVLAADGSGSGSVWAGLIRLHWAGPQRPGRCVILPRQMDSLALPEVAARKATWSLHVRLLTQRLQYWRVVASSRCLL